MNSEFINIYVDFLKKFLMPQRKLKVVFDCSSGTAGPIIKQLTTDNKQLTTYFINDEPDGNFPIHSPDPLKKSAMSGLRETVLRHKADLGIIFDADGDRVFFVDNKGKFVDPDAIARLLIWHLKPKKIIIDVRTGWLIKKIKNQKTNLKIFESRVGHYFIKKLMRKTGADFSAERSGHYYFKSFFYADSGIFAAIQVINAVSKLPYSLADFNDLLPQYYRSGEINIRTDLHGLNTDLHGQLKKVEKKYQNQATKISHIDGLTMKFDSPAGGWWFNLRPSNTELFLRLNIEAENKKVLQKEKKNLIKFLQHNIQFIKIFKKFCYEDRPCAAGSGCIETKKLRN